MSAATYQSTLAGGVVEDAKSSESIVASSVLAGIFGKFSCDGLGQLSWVSERMRRFLGVWKQFLEYVAIADLWSGRPGRQELHGIIKQNNNNPVRKESLTD